MAFNLNVGTTQRLELVRQSLKKDPKTGALKSGQYWSDYYWGLKDIAPQDEHPTRTIAIPGTGITLPPGIQSEVRDGTRVSIERQKAAQIAFDAAPEGELIETTLQRAARIYAWISESEPGQAPSIPAKVRNQAQKDIDELFPQAPAPGVKLEKDVLTEAGLIALAAQKGYAEGAFRNKVKATFDGRARATPLISSAAREVLPHRLPHLRTRKRCVSLATLD